MKKIFLFAVIASLLFAVSCDKKELAPEKKLTKLEQLQKMADENGGMVVKVTNKSAVFLNNLDIKGQLYNYYPNKNSTNDKQSIFLIEQDIKEVINKIKNLPINKDGFGPKYTVGTYGEGPHHVQCLGVAYNCAVYNGTIFR